jgi:diacylglycerol O-acyltransferase
MRQLSAHDAGFLYSDTSHSNANVTLVQIYDQSTAPGGKVRFKSILAHIESRLAGLPIFRSKLQRVPLDLDHPYWVDDPNFDLEYHVRHIALPKPGDWRQFCIQASRIHARPLDQNRPLWEIYVVEGLDSLLELPVGSFALLTKVHHAAVDAEGGSRITMLLHDLTPNVSPPPPPRPWFPQSTPSTASLLWRSWLNSLLSPLQLRTPLARRAADGLRNAVAFAGDLMLRPEQLVATRFNSVVSPHRVFDTRRFMVEEFDAIRRLIDGATLNDAVLAVCGGAMRRHLQGLGELPESSLSAITPVHKLGTGALADRPPQLSWLRLQLGTDIEDDVQRLAAVRAQTAEQGVVDDPAVQGQHAAAATLAMSGKMQGLLGLGSARHAPRHSPSSCATCSRTTWRWRGPCRHQPRRLDRHGRVGQRLVQAARHAGGPVRLPLPLGLREAVGHDLQHQRVEAQPGVAAPDAHVLVQRRVAFERGLLRRDHAVAERIQAADRQWQTLALAHRLGTRLHRVCRRTQRMGHQPVQGLQQRRYRAARGIDGDRAAQRHDVAHAVHGLVGAVQREHTAQAPAHQADLAPALVVHVADLLLDGRRMPRSEADVAPQAPGLHRIAAVAQEQLERYQRAFAAHESR